jgi:hypothetical protein
VPNRRNVRHCALRAAKAAIRKEAATRLAGARHGRPYATTGFGGHARFLSAYLENRQVTISRPVNSTFASPLAGFCECGLSVGPNRLASRPAWSLGHAGRVRTVVVRVALGWGYCTRFERGARPHRASPSHPGARLKHAFLQRARIGVLPALGIAPAYLVLEHGSIA